MLGIAACQAAAVETASQPIDQQDYCAAALPGESTWKPGDKLPELTASTVMISAEIDHDKDRWGVYGVDPFAGKITWVLRLSGPELKKFQLAAVAGSYPYGGVRGPIGGCIRNCGDPDPPVLLNFARLDRQLQAMAEDASASCGK
jgi:hypothetical protein